MSTWTADICVTDLSHRVSSINEIEEYRHRGGFLHSFFVMSLRVLLRECAVSAPPIPALLQILFELMMVRRGPMREERRCYEVCRL